MEKSTDAIGGRRAPEATNGPGEAVCAAEEALAASRRLLQKNERAYRVLAEERPEE